MNVYQFLFAISFFWIFYNNAEAYEQDRFYQTRIEQFNAGVRSWSEMRDDLIVKQKFDMSCGTAALATILFHYYGETIDEMTIIKQIGIKEEYSFADLTQFSEQLGYKVVALSADFALLKRLQIPAILFIDHFGSGHFTVFRGTDHKNIWLGDPAWGNVFLAEKDFLKRWQTGKENKTKADSGRLLLILKMDQKINEAFFGVKNAKKTRFFTNIGKN